MTQNRAKIIENALKEVDKLKKEHRYPDHICSQIGLIEAESGKLMQCGLDIKYGSPMNEEAKEELRNNLRIQAYRTVAAALRFIMENSL